MDTTSNIQKKITSIQEKYISDNNYIDEEPSKINDTLNETDLSYNNIFNEVRTPGGDYFNDSNNNRKGN